MAKNIRMRFGERVRSLRKKRGWTQAELGHRVGLDTGYISDIELGKRNVSLEALEAIATGLKVTSSKLLSRL